MFLQHGFYPLDSLGILLLKDLVSDGSREHMVGDVPSRSGMGNTTSARSTRDAVSDTVASYAIIDE